MATAPELLVPAGNPEKLKVAVKYGADAVYLGGQKYGLRAMSDNFSEVELDRAVEFAFKHKVKTYVTLNAFLHDADLEGLAAYAKFLEEIGVSAVIVSDLGVASLVQEASSLPVHLSTQASCLNSYSARCWKALGVSRIITGREITIVEAGEIARNSGLEVEMFVHGAMCMAYSGNCTISNFTAGRDSNRGGCIQSCRFHYQHQQVNSFASDSLQMTPVMSTEPSNVSDGYFMSSRDQMGVRLIPEFIKNGICSLKIEGRMKSVFYAATLCAAYRRIIDACMDGSINESMYQRAEEEVRSVPHRDYFSGSMKKRASSLSIYEHDGQSATKGSHHYLGIVVDSTPERIALKLARPIKEGTSVEFIDKKQGTLSWQVSELLDLSGNKVANANQESIVLIPRVDQLSAVESYTVARVVAE